MDLIAHKINHKNPKVIIDKNVYIKYDRLKISDKEEIRIIFEGVKSKFKQVITLKIDKKLKNLFNGESFKSWCLWYDGSSKYIDFECTTKKGEMEVSNAWENKDGNIEYDFGGLGMRVEDLPDGSRRYHCNDGELDNDFDDLTFRIQLLNGKKIKSLWDD
jgi:hypothetical protein